MSEKEKKKLVTGYICGPNSFHPYECQGPKKCPHCDKVKFDGHDPDNCALCNYMEDDNLS